MTFDLPSILWNADRRFVRLSPRERQALVLLASGYTVKDIATQWEREVHTVEATRFTMYRKLDLHCIAHVALFVAQRKLIELPSLEMDYLVGGA